MSLVLPLVVLTGWLRVLGDVRRDTGLRRRGVWSSRRTALVSRGLVPRHVLSRRLVLWNVMSRGLVLRRVAPWRLGSGNRLTGARNPRPTRDVMPIEGHLLTGSFERGVRWNGFVGWRNGFRSTGLSYPRGAVITRPRRPVLGRLVPTGSAPSSIVHPVLLVWP